MVCLTGCLYHKEGAGTPSLSVVLVSGMQGVRRPFKISEQKEGCLTWFSDLLGVSVRVCVYVCCVRECMCVFNWECPRFWK